MCTTVTTDGNTSNQAIEVKMTLYIGLLKIFTAVFEDYVSDQLAKMKIKLNKICKIVHGSSH